MRRNEEAGTLPNLEHLSINASPFEEMPRDLMLKIYELGRVPDFVRTAEDKKCDALCNLMFCEEDGEEGPPALFLVFSIFANAQQSVISGDLHNDLAKKWNDINLKLYSKALRKSFRRSEEPLREDSCALWGKTQTKKKKFYVLSTQKKLCTIPWLEYSIELQDLEDNTFLKDTMRNMRIRTETEDLKADTQFMKKWMDFMKQQIVEICKEMDLFLMPDTLAFKYWVDTEEEEENDRLWSCHRQGIEVEFKVAHRHDVALRRGAPPPNTAVRRILEECMQSH
jgi:hypothetical protein